jgi:hypothetical protein
VIAYHFGSANDLDVAEPDIISLDLLERRQVQAMVFHLSQMKAMSELPFIDMLDRHGMSYHFETVESQDEDGFAEYLYLIQVQPLTENPEHTAFLIRINSGRYPLTDNWRDLVRNGGIKRLFAFDPAAFAG